jgi:hypothetical protein
MNRRGDSVGLTYETIIKMVIGAFILIMLIGIGYSLVSLFVSGNEEFQPKRNLELLSERIAHSQKLQEEKTNIVIQLPKDYTLVSFNEDEPVKKIYFQYKSGLSTISYKDIGMPPQIRADNAVNGIPTIITRPGRLLGCSGPCVCVVHDATREVIACETIDTRYVYGVYGEVKTNNIDIRIGHDKVEIGYIGTSFEKPGTWSVDDKGNPKQVVDYSMYMT